MALATQAAMLYVILYFDASTLEKQTAIMREIVDKYFADNWVIPFYMGYTADLSEQWYYYRAAYSALGNVLNWRTVTAMVGRQLEEFDKAKVGLDRYLTEGVLMDEYVLENVRPLMEHVRRCNAVLRWCMLHRNCADRRWGDLVKGKIAQIDLLKLLLNTAQFDFKIKQMFQRLLANQGSRWSRCRDESSGRMRELSEYFSGEKALTRVKRNENLQAWFLELSEAIKTLDMKRPIVSGRKLGQLIVALEGTVVLLL